MQIRQEKHMRTEFFTHAFPSQHIHGCHAPVRKAVPNTPRRVYFFGIKVKPHERPCTCVNNLKSRTWIENGFTHSPAGYKSPFYSLEQTSQLARCKSICVYFLPNLIGKLVIWKLKHVLLEKYLHGEHVLHEHEKIEHYRKDLCRIMGIISSSSGKRSFYERVRCVINVRALKHC